MASFGMLLATGMAQCMTQSTSISACGVSYTQGQQRRSSLTIRVSRNISPMWPIGERSKPYHMLRCTSNSARYHVVASRNNHMLNWILVGHVSEDEVDIDASKTVRRPHV
jgi:hypothetical protein